MAKPEESGHGAPEEEKEQPQDKGSDELKEAKDGIAQLENELEDLHNKPQDKDSDALQEAKHGIAQLENELEDLRSKPHDKGSGELQEAKDRIAQLESEVEDLRNGVPSPSASVASSSHGDMKPGRLGLTVRNWLGSKGNDKDTRWKGWFAIPVALLLVLVAYRKFRRSRGRERIMQSKLLF